MTKQAVAYARPLRSGVHYELPAFKSSHEADGVDSSVAACAEATPVVPRKSSEGDVNHLRTMFSPILINLRETCCR